MKFRYKVLFTNLNLISICLGIMGYFQIGREFYNTRENALQTAVMENNLIQFSVEYELVREINTSADDNIKKLLEQIGKRVCTALSADTTCLIRYEGEYVYRENEKIKLPSDNLFDGISTGTKNYEFIENNGKAYIEITSCSEARDSELCIVTIKDITEIFNGFKEQILYYIVTMFITLILGGGIMFIVSMMLTKPLSRLEKAVGKIADGDYSVRADIVTNDEIGTLSREFNSMAESIDSHVNELNDMVHRREQFVADFTHEIKTPMTTIIGYADTIRSIELSRDEQIMAAGYIFSEGKRLESLSGKLFDLLYLKNHDISMMDIQAENLINDVCETMSPALEERNIMLSVSAESAVFKGDRELILTAIINLVDNARKASGDGESISITGKKAGDKYTIAVKDSGCGMTPEQVKHICDEFYMADKSRTRREGGAGIGMSLVSVIMERHNAGMTIDSAIGKGTEVILSFDMNGGGEK